MHRVETGKREFADFLSADQKVAQIGPDSRNRADYVRSDLSSKISLHVPRKKIPRESKSKHNGEQSYAYDPCPFAPPLVSGKGEYTKHVDADHHHKTGRTPMVKAVDDLPVINSQVDVSDALPRALRRGRVIKGHQNSGDD